MIHILIVDDHPIVRDGLAAVLSTQVDFAVVGEAGDGVEALRQINLLHPDILLLDLEMPRMDGVATLLALKEQNALLPTIVFTAFDTDEQIVAAIHAGARGYLLKGAPRESLFAAVRVVYAGGSLLEPIVASRLLERLNRPPSASPDALTQRESEVLHLLAAGLANRQIAERLVVTERTVKFHVGSIMGKLNASNRTEAVAIANKLGLLKG